MCDCVVFGVDMCVIMFVIHTDVNCVVVVCVCELS